MVGGNKALGRGEEAVKEKKDAVFVMKDEGFTADTSCNLPFAKFATLFNHWNSQHV